MNKTAIKNFAIWARNKLIAGIQYRAGLMGITADGIKDPLPQSTGTMEFYDIGTSEPYAISGEAISQRKKLVEIIRKKEKDSNYATAYKYILEEVAYTWFNRLIAIRFMEVNDYLPSHIRVLSSESGKIEPDLVTTPFDAELAYTSAEEETVLRLKTENKLDELFRLLFIKQCNALNEILPALFETTNDYTELLLNLSVVDQEGVVYHLIHDIDEDDFNIEKGGQVEIIGWLYQYYNTEPKNAAFAKNGKITKEEIPAVTQLFTPDWIVRYMVENSLGRIFISGQLAVASGQWAVGSGQWPVASDQRSVASEQRSVASEQWSEAERIEKEKALAEKMGWRYYLPEAEQTPEVRAQLNKLTTGHSSLTTLKIIDPCMGSGHILVYAFDVLMQMYENDGYSQRDAAQCILENNLFGLDIDERAAQLAYFAVMMKARQYDRRIFSRGIQPHVYAIAESNGIDAFTRNYFANNDPKLKEALDSIINDLHDAKEYGSILTVAPVDFAALHARVEEVKNDISFHKDAVLNTILPLIRVAEVLSQQYDVVVTNPPYLSSANMSGKLSDFVKNSYPDTKSDLCTCFIEKSFMMLVKHGFSSMITMESWMSLSSYKNMRHSILEHKTINILVHMPYLGKGGTSLGINFGTSATITKNARIKNFVGTYSRVTYTECDGEGAPYIFPVKNEYYNTVNAEWFKYIPGMPITAYYASDAVFSNFKKGTYISDVAIPASGTSTGDNDRFLRFWHEVWFGKINFNAHNGVVANGKWFPCNKGGAFRRWAGGGEYLIDWESDGYRVRNCSKAFLRNVGYTFLPGLTWSKLGSGTFSIRYFPAGFICESIGCCLFSKFVDLKLILALLNTKVAAKLLEIINPSMGRQPGYIGTVPYVMRSAEEGIVKELTGQNIELSTFDWDSFETSWDFQKHPLA